MEAKKDTVWYFAYGSNLASNTFTDHRGIEPLAAARVRVPGWTLEMDVPGTPYTEPAFASVRSVGEAEKAVAVVGMAYLVTREQLAEIVASEGGGIMYRAVSLRAEPVAAADEVVAGPSPTVCTLTTRMPRRPPALPSQRYKDLILAGADEVHLPDDYRERLARMPAYRTPSTLSRRVGALLFLALWTPVMRAVELLIPLLSDRKGNVPLAVAILIRTVVFCMWWHHDHVHARLWGRGDGLDQDGVEDV